MAVLIHVLIAIASLIVSTLTYAAPSRAKIRADMVAKYNIEF